MKDVRSNAEKNHISGKETTSPNEDSFSNKTDAAKESREYFYDAFISYHHVPMDSAIAARLQEYLESLHWKDGTRRKRKLRIFRDKSELSSSYDLNSEIKNILRQSRFLIVICSEETKKSWCMEEIKMFKEIHNGSTRQILILLTSGERKDIIPNELLFENLPKTAEDDAAEMLPLCANVRAGSLKESLSKLKTEYLRIAAPLLDCRFDDLYQRRQRRRRRNAIAICTGAFTLLTTVLFIVSIFAYRTWVSEKNYKETLADNYIREGNNYAASASPQEALLYYVQALDLDPQKTSASLGASLLLQDYSWPVFREENSGCLREGIFLPSPFSKAGDPQNGRYLHITLEQGRVADENGNTLAELGADYTDYIGSSAGWWSFATKDRLLFYNPLTEQKRSIPWPEEKSAGCASDSYPLYEQPNVRAVSDNKIIVTYYGIIYIYTFDEQGNASETIRADLAEIFPKDAEQNGIARVHDICLSKDCSLALITSHSHAALFDTDTLSLKAVVPRYRDSLNGMAISPDNQYFALAYGNTYHIDLHNPNGFFEVYSCSGELQYASYETHKESLLGVTFSPANPDLLLAWSSDYVRVWDWKKGTEIMAPLRENNIRCASFTQDGSLLTDTDAQTVSRYVLTDFHAPDDKKTEPETLPYDSAKYYLDAEGPDGKTLTGGSATLTLKDADGSTLDTASLPVMSERVALSADCKTAYLFSNYVPALMRAEIDFQTGTIGKIQQFDTGEKEVLSIWFDDGWLAAETVSRDLLLFDENGMLQCRITPKHAGNIVSLFADPGLHSIVLIINTTTGNSQDFHFDKTGAVEIWDCSSRLLLSSFEENGHKINAAALSDNGSLVWNTNDQTYIRLTDIPAPDEAAFCFLKQLCSLTLDKNENPKPKKPETGNQEMGSWSVLRKEENSLAKTAVTAEGRNESNETSGESLLECARTLYQAADNGSDAWYIQCDRLWQRLLDNELDFRPLELDYFYTVYIRAVTPDSVPKLAFGLQSYIDLTLQMLQVSADEENPEPLYSDFNNRLMETLAITKDYDKQIIQAFSKIAHSNKTESARPSSQNEPADETDKLNTVYSAYTAEYMEALAEALRGNGAASMSSLKNYANDHSLPFLITAEPYILSELFRGNADSAADYMNEWIQDYLSVTPEDETDSITESLTSYLLGSEIFVWRKQIDTSVFNRYLQKINADTGLEISEISVEAQHAGLMTGDLITSIDGIQIADLYQYHRLRQPEKTQTLELLRNGERKQITLSKSTPVKGKMNIRLPKIQ